MNVNNLSSFYNSALSFIRSSRFLTILTIPQAKIAAVAIAAFGCLAATYAFYRSRSQNKEVPPVPNLCRTIVPYTGGKLSIVPENLLDKTLRSTPKKEPESEAPVVVVLPEPASEPEAPVVVLLPEPDPEPEVAPEAEPEPEPDPAPEPVVEAEPAAELMPEPAAAPVPEPEPEPEAAPVHESAIVVVPTLPAETAIVAAPPGFWNRFKSAGNTVLGAPVTLAAGGWYVAKRTGQAVSRTAIAAVDTGTRTVAKVVDVVNQASEVYNKFNNAIVQAQDGINLYPMFKNIAVDGAGRAVAFWNAPAMQVSAVPANFVNGFAAQFGAKMHFLLLNAATLNSPALAQALATKLNLVGNGSVAIADKWLSWASPLGWTSMLVDVTSGGAKLFGSFEHSVMSYIEDQIDDLIVEKAKRLNIRQDALPYIRQDCRVRAAEHAMDIEHNKFIAKLAEEGITAEQHPGYFGGISPRWWEAYEDKAHPEYFETKERFLREDKILQNLAVQDTGIADFIKLEIKTQLITRLSLVLKNTLRKTLTDFTYDMLAQIDADANPGFTSALKNKAKKIIPNLILGKKSRALGFARNAQLPMSQVSALKNRVLTSATKPFTIGKTILAHVVPTAMQNRFIRTVNHAVAPVLYDVLAPGFEAAAIEKMGLQRLRIFEAAQTKLDLREAVQNSALTEPKKNMLAIFLDNSPWDMNTLCQQLIEQAGNKFGNIFALKLAEHYRKSINERNLLNYSADDLTSKELELPLNRRVVRKAGTLVRDAVRDQIWNESKNLIAGFGTAVVTVGRAGGFLAPAEPRWDDV